MSPRRIEPSSVRAVILDMDGLMFDTERLCCSVWRQVGEEAGYSFSERVFLDCVGRNEQDSRRIVLDALGVDFPYDAMRQEVRVRMGLHMSELGPPEKPGLRELTGFLRERGIPTALATSSRRKSAMPMIERAGLGEYFSAYVFGDEVSRGKPDPEIFQKALDALNAACGGGIAPAECLVFEDSTAGLAAAASAGIPSVFVKDLLDPPADVMERVWLDCASLDRAVPLIEPLILRA